MKAVTAVIVTMSILSFVFASVSVCCLLLVVVSSMVALVPKVVVVPITSAQSEPKAKRWMVWTL